MTEIQEWWMRRVELFNFFFIFTKCKKLTVTN
jgi:hypothetical protein